MMNSDKFVHICVRGGTGMRHGVHRAGTTVVQSVVTHTARFTGAHIQPVHVGVVCVVNGIKLLLSPKI